MFVLSFFSWIALVQEPIEERKAPPKQHRRFSGDNVATLTRGEWAVQGKAGHEALVKTRGNLHST